MSKHPPREQWKTEQPITASKKHRKKITGPTSVSVGLNQKILLPTQIHPIDGSLMVLVDPLVLKNNQLRSSPRNATDSSSLLKAPLDSKLFYIDHTEVTLKQYKKTHPNHNQTYVTGKYTCLSCPAMGVKWNDANKHCQSVGKRLPTEEEWESAARGRSKKLLPLIKKIGKPRANLVGEKDGFLSVAPVGSFPLGAGFYGVMDMIGNVWEWVSTPHSPLPKNLKPKKNKTLRIAKGGSWASPNHLATTDYRNVVDGDMKNPTFGFRCVKSITR